jgi:hypothetical protein
MMAPSPIQELPILSQTLPLSSEACAPARVEVTHVSLVAGPEALLAAERAAEALRADGHTVSVVPIDGLAALAGADAVLVLGGLDLEAQARAAAPAHAYVRGELLEGPQAGWDTLVLRAARSTALAAEPPMLGMCG